MSHMKRTLGGRLLALIMTLALALTLVTAFGGLTAKAAGSTGTPDTSWYNTTDTTFSISTANELAGLASLVNAGNSFSGKTITLTADIDLTAYPNWTPICTRGNSFTGTFDGAGHVISNLTIDSSDNYVGLFGCINGTVENVAITSGSITGDSTSFMYVGGVVGLNNGMIQNCRNAATVTATDYSVNVGGVIGCNNGTVQYCCNTGEVSGSGSVGGVAGSNGDGIDGTVQYCYNTGTVSGSGDVGGVAGLNGSISISISIIGTVQYCYNNGAVIGSGSSGDIVGGVAGSNSNGIVQNCYNTGAVTATGNYIGGVAGSNGSSSSNSGTVQYCYNTGAVTATGTVSKVGGVAGFNYGASPVTACFFDSDTGGGVTFGIGNDSTSSTMGMTTVNMQTETTFTGWDFSIKPVWSIDDGNDYPKLMMPVCYIVETGATYTTLQDAVTLVNTASSDQTIGLLADLPSEGCIAFSDTNYTITLALNGFELDINNASGDGIDMNFCSLVVKGPGTLTVIAKDYGIYTFQYDITITDVTKVTISGASGIFAGGAVTIDNSNVNVTATGDSSMGIAACNGAVTINGGEVDVAATGNDSFGIYASDAVTIDGAVALTIFSDNNGINTNGGVTIKSGTVDISVADGSGVVADNVTISGGLVMISATDFGIMAGAALTISGGSGTISGGLYYAVSCGNRINTGDINLDPGMSVKGADTGGNYTVAAQITEVSGNYKTFADAANTSAPLTNIKFGPGYSVSFDTASVAANGVTATGLIAPIAGGWAEGDTVAVTVTLTGTATANGTQTIGLSSATLDAGNITITAPASVTKTVTAGQSVAAGDTFTFTFTMPASAVDDLVVTNIVTLPDPQMPTGLTATYGDTLSSVSLPSGWAWDENGTTPVGAVGPQTHNASYTDAHSITPGALNDKANAAVSIAVNPATISAAAVTVTAPVRGATPDTTASTSETGYICGAVSWSPTATSTFAASTVYTASVTLTADANYAFGSGFTATINGNQVTPTINQDGTVTLSYQFAATGGGGGGGGTTPVTNKNTTAIGGNTVTTPDGQSPVSNPDGTTTLPGGGTVKTPGGTVIDVPPGTVIDGTGNVITLPNGNDGGSVTQGGNTTDVDPGMTINITDGGAATGGYTVGWNDPFTDVNTGDWFYGDVQYIATHGLMNGTGATLFSPNADTTRAMLITILARAVGIDTSGGDTWYSAAVAWGIENGITDGTNLNDNITREQLAAMLYRYAQYAGIELPDVRAYPSFTDGASIGDYAQAVVQALYEAGVINGRDDDSFGPQGQATRAEVAAMVHRLLEAVG